MKLWHISQDTNNGYDTYSDAVVAAETEEEARMTHPNGHDDWDGKRKPYDDWSAVTDVKVELIGEAAPGINAGVICASFHAG